MELILKRNQINPNHTISHLFDAQSKQYFVFDVLEPPLQGMVSVRETSALPKGEYKVYVKGTAQMLSIILQHSRRKLRYGFHRPLSPVGVKDVNFRVREFYYNTALYLGKWQAEKGVLEDAPQMFERLIYRILIAKNSHEVIKLIIK